MFDTRSDFLVTAVDHRSGLRIAKIATSPFNNVYCFRVAIATVRTSKAPLSWFKIPFKVTLVATVYWSIGPKIAHTVIGIIPNSFQGFRILLKDWILSTIDETT